MDDLFDEYDVKMGRLEGEEKAEQPWFRSVRPSKLRRPKTYSTRPVSAEGRQAFHFNHGFISRTPRLALDAGRKAGRAEGRQWLYPTHKGDHAIAVSLGAKRDRSSGRYFLPSGITGEIDARISRMSSTSAREAWLSRRMGKARSEPGTARAFQLYIERAELEGESLRSSVETDGAGFLSFGTLGRTQDERAAFWSEVESVERRRDARLQCRIISELPHELTPRSRREIVERFCEAFQARGLAYWAVVHLPDPSQGMDARNIHLHVVYHDRPTVRVGPMKWQFADRKDRKSRGPEWIAFLRRRMEAICNEALRREGHAKRLDCRSYEDMGIDKEPGHHLGPRQTQRERAGLWTRLGEFNRIQEDAFAEKRMREGRATDRRPTEELVRSVMRLPTPKGDRLWRAYEELTELARKLNKTEEAIDAILARQRHRFGAIETARGRIRQRLTWLQRLNSKKEKRRRIGKAGSARDISRRAVRESHLLNGLMGALNQQAVQERMRARRREQLRHRFVKARRQLRKEAGKKLKTYEALALIAELAEIRRQQTALLKPDGRMSLEEWSRRRKSILNYRRVSRIRRDRALTDLALALQERNRLPFSDALALARQSVSSVVNPESPQGQRPRNDWQRGPYRALGLEGRELFDAAVGWQVSFVRAKAQTDEMEKLEADPEAFAKKVIDPDSKGEKMQGLARRAIRVSKAIHAHPTAREMLRVKRKKEGKTQPGMKSRKSGRGL